MSDLTSLGVTELTGGLFGKHFSAEEVMTATLDRIEKINPLVNAIVSLRSRDELMAEARAADAREPKERLHGVPVAIKDLVATKGLRTTHGSPILSDLVPQADDLLARRIRKAGAIIIGKTNTSEFGLGSQSYNPVHGVTRTPYDLTRTAGGSSGGAGAALAARLVSVTDGSDMMGSLRNPAAYCNVYGFRPSYGLVPSEPSRETFLHQLATDGPMARSVEDLALMLDVLAGPDPRHPHATSVPPSFSNLLTSRDGPRRIGWIGNWNGHYPMEEGVLALCEEGLKTFSDSGHFVSTFTPDFDPVQLWHAWICLRAFAVSSRLKPYFDDEDTRKLLKPEARFEVEFGLSLCPTQIAQASAIRSSWFAYVATLFESYDVLVLPSAQVFPFPAEMSWPNEINGKEMTTYHQWMDVVIPVSLIGLPALNVPVGFSATGLPMGMQLIGPRGSDDKLLRLGQFYHERTDWPHKRPPMFDAASGSHHV